MPCGDTLVVCLRCCPLAHKNSCISRSSEDKLFRRTVCICAECPACAIAETPATVLLAHQQCCCMACSIQLKQRTSVLLASLAPLHTRTNSRASKGPTLRSNSTSSEINNRQALQSCGLFQKMERRLNILGKCIQLVLVHGACLSDLALYSAFMSDTANAFLRRVIHF